MKMIEKLRDNLVLHDLGGGNRASKVWKRKVDGKNAQPAL